MVLRACAAWLAANRRGLNSRLEKTGTMTVAIRNVVIEIQFSVTTIISTMRAETLVLLVFISLAAFVFCEESKVTDSKYIPIITLLRNNCMALTF